MAQEADHQCVNCKSTFNNLEEYVNHKKLYDQHECLVCHLTIQGLNNYVYHKNQDCKPVKFEPLELEQGENTEHTLVSFNSQSDPLAEAVRQALDQSHLPIAEGATEENSFDDKSDEEDEDNNFQLFNDESENLKYSGSDNDPLAEDIFCYICKTTTKGYENFQSHLACLSHKNAVNNLSDESLLDIEVQKILLSHMAYQCQVCKLSCACLQDMVNHVQSPSHLYATAKLTSVFVCEPCSFYCQSNNKLMEHLQSENCAQRVGQPHVIRTLFDTITCPHYNDCSFFASSVDSLIVHLKTQHAFKSTQGCPFCLRTINSLKNLEDHIIRKHWSGDAKQTGIRCNVCDVYIQKHNCDNHKKVSKKHQERLKLQTGGTEALFYGTYSRSKDKFVCASCEVLSDNYLSLKQHYNESHAQHFFTCMVCLIKFDNTNLMQSHLQSDFHKQRESLSDENKICQTCGRQFDDPKKLKMHTMIVHTHNLTEASAMKENPFLGINEKYHKFVQSVRGKAIKEVVDCPECGENIKKLNIYKHLRKHSGSRAFSCLMCSKSFQNPDVLRTHMKHEHFDLRNFVCDFCGKTFVRQGDLRDHINQNHTGGGANYMCEICSKGFKLEKNLKAHMHTHQEKSLSCPENGCVYKTHNKIALKTHMLTHGGIKPWICEQCGYAAKQKRLLGYHIKRVHTECRTFPCQYCDYKAKSKRHLENHLRVHSGSRPYKCPYCNYSSAVMSNIHKHISDGKLGKHRGLPKYPCQLCKPANNIGFNTLSDFRNHLVQIHEIPQKNLYNHNMSIYSGIYHPDEDRLIVPEGDMPRPVHVKRSNTERVAKSTEKTKNPRKNAKSKAKWQIGKMTKTERQVAETITNMSSQEFTLHTPQTLHYETVAQAVASVQQEHLEDEETHEERVLLEFNNMEEDTVIYITSVDSVDENIQQIQYI